MKLRSALLGAAAALAVAPMAAHAGRATDGNVKIIYWQAPSILNPYLSGGTKDIESSSLVIEPLARYDPEGNLVPFLAQDIPTLENGGVSKDLKSITWKLKPGLKWSDGSPVTSKDVVFTYKYCTDPAGGCAQLSKFEGVKDVTAVDDLTIKVDFSEPKPNPYLPFTGGQSPIIQAKQFENCMGAKAPTCTKANFGPIGTGPFVVTEFKPNDVIQMKANDNYRDPNKPAFATLTFKGGGDAASAARAVMETGEYDYAWNLQLAPDVLKKMEAGGKGHLIVGFGSLVERIMMNMTDASPDLGPDVRSTDAHPNPILKDEKVRQALSMALDRKLLVQIGYGDAGKPTCDLVPAPKVYAAENTSCFKQDIAGANKLLDEAGWKMGGDGIREKDGKKLKLVFQTSTNAVRQDFQSLIKQWWKQIGVDTELKNIDASVFFGGDAGSPDTFQKFYADVEMYANNFDGTDPEQYMAQYMCSKAPSPKNQWQGENVTRYCNPEYDKLVKELGQTGELAKRAEIVKKLNNMLTVDSYTVLGLVDRGRVSGEANTLGGHVMNTWDSELWDAASWFRKK